MNIRKGDIVFHQLSAIAFMNWTLSDECSYSCTDEDQWTHIYDSYESITSEQLYQKFIEQKNT